MSSLHERVSRGEYKSKLPYGPAPKRHAILSMNVAELADSQIAAIRGLRAEHEEMVLRHDAQRMAWGKDTAALQDKFVADLFEEYGIDPKVELAHMIYRQAYEQGHDSGLESVMSIFDDLVPFYVEAMAMVQRERKLHTGSLTPG